MKKILAILSLMLFVLHAGAQTLEQKIDNFYNIYKAAPGMGMAVGVVQNGKLTFFKGYGYRDHDKQLPVTAETLFAIGSNSKAFTSLAISMLNDEGRAHIEAPLAPQLSGFAMSDATVTPQITPIDMMSHRTGLPRHDLLWYITPFTRAELVSRIPFLAMNKHAGMGFRGGFQYNNLMYLTIGYWAEKLSGVPYEQVIHDRVLAPIGMNETNLSVTEMQKSADFALPYFGAQILPFKDCTSIAPAGAVNSNMNDLVKWTSFHLQHGVTAGGQTLISHVAHDRLFHQESDASPMLPGNDIVGYGLGWFLQDIGGHRVIWHGGNIDGFSTFISFVPDTQTAVIVLTNESNGNLFEFPITAPAANGHAPTELLPLVIYEDLFGVKPAPAALGFDLFAHTETHLDRLRLRPHAWLDVSRVAVTADTAPVADYVGTYHDNGYGEVSVTLVNGALTLNYYDNHWPLTAGATADTFDATVSMDGQQGALPTVFHRTNGMVDGLTLPMEPDVDPILFRRK